MLCDLMKPCCPIWVASSVQTRLQDTGSNACRRAGGSGFPTCVISVSGFYLFWSTLRAALGLKHRTRIVGVVVFVRPGTSYAVMQYLEA